MSLANTTIPFKINKRNSQNLKFTLSQTTYK